MSPCQILRIAMPHVIIKKNIYRMSLSPQKPHVDVSILEV